jgi:predicted translin family RNA/ssDNA-binding protein
MTMLKNLLLVIVFIGLGLITYVIYTSQRTFQATFKNVDGLPKGAPVTALGVRVGEVIRTKPLKNGILVTIRITKKSFNSPEPGSQLAITSFRPGQGRVIEVIPPKRKVDEQRAWIVQEPITNQSWLYASLDILDGIERFSRSAISYVTPENFNETRSALKIASNSLNQTASHLSKYEDSLLVLKDNLSEKADEGNRIVNKANLTLSMINKSLNIDSSQVKKGFAEFEDNLANVSSSVENPDLPGNLKNFKSSIQTYLADVNSSLVQDGKMIDDPVHKEKYFEFKSGIQKLNTFIAKHDVSKILPFKEKMRKASEVTAKASEKSNEFAKQN